MGPGDLHQMLSGLDRTMSVDHVLVDMRDSDDAGVVRLDRTRGLVHTIDVITPIVDDPKTFGRVAAANAVSDIYAMGADPTSAVSLLSVPKALPARALAPMLRAAGEMLEQAGAFLVGGHTLKDNELKLGFAVTGTVASKHLVTNRGAKPRQVVLLTKPLGTGILYQAMKRGVRSSRETKALVASMTTLNKRGKEAMVEARVRCGTDVTGFGLVGHALNVARASDVDVVLSAGALPALAGVEDHLKAGVYPGTIDANIAGYGRSFKPERGVSEDRIRLAADPQTSGGLLIVVDPKRVPVIQGMVEAFEIGEIRPKRAERAAVRLVA